MGGTEGVGKGGEGREGSEDSGKHLSNAAVTEPRIIKLPCNPGTM